MRFRGFANVPWNSVFQRYYIEKECGYKSAVHSSLYYALKIVILSFFQRERYELDNNDSSILFFMSHQERKAYGDSLYNIQHLAKSDLLHSPQRDYKRFHFFEGLRIVFLLIPNWYCQVSTWEKKLRNQLFLLQTLVDMYWLSKKLDELNLEKYRLVVTFYDSFPIESYVVEYFRLHNVKSASLQHGQFTCWCEDTLINSGVELRTFKSDYLLCWNKFTYDEAIKCGIDRNKLVVTGIWSYVNEKRTKCTQNNNGVFGVVIGHPSWNEENEVLVKAANLISEKYNLKYYLKLHPQYSESYFSNLVNSHYIGNIKKGINMKDYANIVDFSIVGSSSVFVELVYIGHDIYRYSSGAVDDKYRSVMIGKYFSNLNELDVLFKERREDRSTDALFDYLCTIEDVASSYRSFFERFL